MCLPFVYRIVCAFALLFALSLTSEISTAQAAESVIDTTIFASNTNGHSAGPASVCVTDQTCFVFYLDSGGGISMASTTDGGATWTAGRNVDNSNTTDAVSVAIWWDGWTPPSTTTDYIHIATTDTGVDDIFYIRYDIANNTFSSAATGTTQAAACTRGTDCYPAITKASDGTLYMATAEGADRWVVRCTTTCTTAGNWSEMALSSTSAFYGAPGDDIPFLMPVPGTNNIMLLWKDITLSDILYNIYSATTSSWVYSGASSGTISTAAESSTLYEAQLMGMALSTSTGKIGLVYADDVNDYTTSDHDIAFWTYATATGFVQGTNPTTTALGGITGSKLLYDEGNDVWYLVYGRRSTVGVATTGNIYYATSSSGASWSTEQGPVNDNADDISALTTGITSFERVGAWWNYATAPRADQEFYDLVADISPPADGGGSTIYLSGNVYSDEGSTLITNSRNLKIAIGTSSVSLSATTSLASGAWNFTVPSGNTISSSTPILVYFDGYGSSSAAALLTKASSTNSVISGLDLYQNRVIIRHEGTSGTSTTFTDMGRYDGDDDSDIQFTLNNGALVVSPYQKLYVWPSSTFQASGTIEVRGNASSTSITDGSLHLATSSTLIVSGTTTLAGSLTASTSATFSHPTTTLVFNATTTGKIINASMDLGTTSFEGSGGGWAFATSATTSNLTITAGTVALPVSNLTVTGNYINSATATARGVQWSPRSAAGDNDGWWGLTYAAGTYVVVGYNADRVMTSPDGINWTARSAAGDDDGWVDVVYGGGKFVAVGNCTGVLDCVMYSTDGALWTAVSGVAGDDDNWTAITYYDGLFVAVGQDGDTRVITSPDGITWTAQTALGDNDSWYDVTYGDGLFVAVGNTGTDRVMTSPDGVNWTVRSAANDDDQWHAITYGNGVFVAVGQGSDYLMTSTDGTNWTARSVLGNDDAWTDVTYGRGLFIAVSSSGDNRAMISHDGYAWLPVADAAGNNDTWNAVIQGGDSIVAVGEGSDYVMTSTIGTTTFLSATSQTITGNITGTSTLGNVAFLGTSTKSFGGNASTTHLRIEAGSTLISTTSRSIFGDYRNNGTSSVRGESWTPVTVSEANGWYSVAYGNGVFVAVSYFGTNIVMTSADGLSWTPQSAAGNNDAWYKVAFFNGQFIAVGDGNGAGGGDRVMTSPDGVTWTPQTAAEANFWIGITYGNGIYVAVALNGTNRVMTSTNGTSWTPRSAVSNDDVWNDVVFANGLFVAVGIGGDFVMTSPDGINWTAQTVSSANQWTSVTYGNGLFVAVAEAGDANRIMTSPDATNWTVRAAPETNEWYSVRYGNGLFVASAISGTNRLMTSADGITWRLHAIGAEAWRGVGYGNNRYVAVAEASDQVVTSIIPTTTFDGSVSQTLSGTLTGTSSLGAIAFSGVGTKSFSSNASTSRISVESGGVVSNTQSLTVFTDLVNNGVISGSSGTTTFLENDIAQSISGNMGSSSVLGALVFGGNATKTIGSNATITNLINGTTTNATTSLVLPGRLTVLGNFTQLDTMVAGSGTTTFAGTGAQIATGTLTGTNAFRNIEITNSSGASTTFAAPITATGIFYAYAPGGIIEFIANSTTTLATSSFIGGSGNNLKLRSTTAGSRMGLIVGGPYTITYLDVKDSAACGSTGGGITFTTGTTTGNTVCWTFNGTQNAAILLSGTLYTDEGRTAFGVTRNLRVAVGTTSTSVTATTSLATGVWNLTLPVGNEVATSTPILVWLDSYGTTTSGAVFTKASSTNTVISGLNLYQGHLIIRHEATVGSSTLSDLGFYDGDNDSDIQFTSNNGALIVSPNQKLYVWPSKTFTASGTVEVRGNASSTSPTDGSFHLATSSVFTIVGTTTLAGSFTASTSATFTHATSALVMNATTTGKVVRAAMNMGTTTFSGAGGGWSFATSGTTTNFEISTSTALVTSAYGLTIMNHATITGAFVQSAGTTTFAGTATQTIAGTSGSTTFSHLHMRGGGDKFPTLPLEASGNFLLDSGTIYRASSSLTVGGHFTQNGTLVATSSEWVTRSAASANPWVEVGYGGGTFVALSYSGTNRAMTSTDGITWTERQATSSAWWNDIVYASSTFVAVGGTLAAEKAMYSLNGGVNWATATPPYQNNYTSVTYGNGLFVAVSATTSTNTVVMTSPDGINWTARAGAAGNSWISVAYGDGIFVAVAANGLNRVMTSPNGIDWTSQSAAEANWWRSVTYGNGLFVAVSQDGTNRVMTSPNGVTWTARSAAAQKNWDNVTYGGGLFVAVSDASSNASNSMMISPDGINWTSQSAAEANSWNDVTYGNGLFVAVSEGGTNRVMTMAGHPLVMNGSSAQSLSGTMTGSSVLPSLHMMGAGNKTIGNNASTTHLVTYASAGSVSLPTAFTVQNTIANDGTVSGGTNLHTLGKITNTGTFTSATNHYATGSIESSGTFTGGTNLYLSGNATNTGTFNAPTNWYLYGTNQYATGSWSGAPNMTLSGSGYKTLYGYATTTNLTISSNTTLDIDQGLSVAGSYANSGTTTVARLIWTPRSAGGDDDSWSDVTYGNGLFVAVGSGPDVVMTSPDGILWTPQTAADNDDQWRSVTYGNGLFVAVGCGNCSGAGDVVMTSPDGISWTPQSAGGNDDVWNDVTYGNGLFVAVGIGPDVVMTSLDGTTWTPQSAAGDDDLWFSVTYGNGLFVAVGGQSTDIVMTSPDGISWTPRTVAGGDDIWKSVTYGSGLFVAVGVGDGNGTGVGDFVMTSPDGIAWTALSLLGNNDEWEEVLYANGLFVAVVGNTYGGGSDDRVMTSRDGQMWYSVLNAAGNNDDWLGAAYGSSTLIAVGSASEKVMTTFVPTTTFNGGSAQALSGNLTGAHAMGNVVFSGGGTKTFSSNASTSHFAIASGATVVAPSSLTISGGYTNNGTFTAGSGTTTFPESLPQTLSGTMTGTSAFNSLVFYGSATKTLASNASTTHLTNGSSATTSTSTLVLPNHLTILGNFNQLDALSAGSGTTTFGGTILQTATGSFTGTNAFNNIAITNSSATTTFAAPLTSTGYFYASTTGTRIAFVANSTTTLASTTITGSSGNNIMIRSTTPGSQSYLVVNGAYAMSYIDVKDSSACGSTGGGISFSTGTTSGNTTCWNFSDSATISSAANQTFAVGYATSTISQITITEPVTPSITATNDIRIKIATSTVRMLWDTTDTSASFGGTASSKVSGTVSYENNGATLLINVTSNFSANDTLTISGLSFAQFTGTNTATSALGIYTDGAGDVTVNGRDSKTVTIAGTFAVGNHSQGQISDAFSAPSATDLEVFRFRITPGQETFTITEVVLNISGVSGIISSDLTNARICRDSNNDGDCDAVDPYVGGSGSAPSISGQTGTITWVESFTATSTARDYVVILDTTNIVPGDMMTFSLSSVGITASGDLTGVTVPYISAVPSVQHIRGGGGQSGIHASGAAVGGDAPSGQGIRSGGGSGGGDDIDTNTGGTSLGDEPGFEEPGSNGTPQGSWTTGGNAYISDGSYATAASTNLRHTFGTFGFNVPNSNTIAGIEVKIEAAGTTGAGTIEVALSWNGGSNVTSYKSTPTLTTSDAVYSLGGPSDTWGRSWTPSEAANGSFTIEVRSQPSANTVRIDAIRVRIYHNASGGGGGGGGMVFIPREELPPATLRFLTSLGVDLKGFKGWYVVTS